MDTPKPMGMTPRLAIGLALAIGLDTAVQVVWKKGAVSLPELTGAPHAAIVALIVAVLHQPLFLLVIALLIAQMVNWLKTLDHADVSYAQPFTALSYLGVALVSRLWFGEPITLGRVAGMVLILAGVVLVARSAPNTEAVPSTPIVP